MAELIKKTLIEILKNKNIIVPEIQREYVWGSKENIENCKNILNDIIDNTENNYNIGFLYSYEKDNKVYLIDAQQRFTTLYLTLLYLSVKENDKYKDYLNNFSYKVRNLTKEFINLMIEKIDKEEDFFDIENKTWCLSVYKKDPTIKNIINFFSIFQKNGEDNKYKNISLENIEKTEFWYFNTSNTSQGEELYITMNSRGEQNSEYEDTRVSLLSEIEEKTEYEYKAKEFNKIEHFFWKHRYKGENNANEEFDKFLKQVIALSKFESEESNSNSIGDVDSIKITNIKNKKYLQLDDIIKNYYSLELLYKLLENINDAKYLTKFINKDKTINNSNILNISTIIIPFLYIVKNVFGINDFNNIKENTKQDLFQWLRFLYNIRFNHNSVSIINILIMIKNNNKNTYVNIFDFFECKDKNELFDYYKNYNGEIGEFDLLESEVNKIKFLSIYNDDISTRNDLQKLFWQLENHVILKGNIDYIIKYSLEAIKVEDIKQNFYDTFSNYKNIFETCFNEEKVPRGILIRALLTFAKPVKREESHYFQSHALYDNWSKTYNVHKVSLCRDTDDLHDSFQNKKRDKYETNLYYKTLFDEIIKNPNNEIKDTLIKVIEDFKKESEDKQKKNPFYKIINDENYIRYFGYIAYDINKSEKIIHVMSNDNFHSCHREY
ncbi:DUF262 domain-containing protein [Brachyspira alvinipulli]|uniref:DUF262 domain-containing protein n=1 Tax=Brachyspira alvinipulli TaxID=84379 RepID=UPI0030056F1A